MRNLRIRLLPLIVLMFAFVSCDNEKGITYEPEVENSELVSINDALTRADAMFSQVYGETRSDREPSSVVRFLSKHTRGNENLDSEGFYIVNYKEGGFSVLSADTRDMNRVYAISNEGALHLEDTVNNPELGLYMNEILPSLAAGATILRPDLPTLPIDTIMPINPGWSYFKKHSDPLLTGFMATFHQTSPYNAYCNTGAPDYKPQYVGCVPLAVGTVMGYNKWPQNLDGYAFDWGAMYGNAQDQRWARLFKILGGPLYTNVTYGVVGGGTGTGLPKYNISNALTNAFTKAKYTGTQITTFSPYSVGEELENKCPVICVGFSAKNSGHAWVIDGGYTDGTIEYPATPGGQEIKVYRHFYHCVWGWNGLSNGYYLYSNSLGGDIQTGDPGYVVSAEQYNDLQICYGYRPKK